MPNTATGETMARKSAANALLFLGVAYGSSCVAFWVRAHFEHEWGSLGMAILAFACVPPALLFIATQGAVRRGKAAGWAMLLTVLLGGPVAWFLLMGFQQLQWSVPSTGEVIALIISVALLSFHVRTLILLGRWSDLRTLAAPSSPSAPEPPWSPFDEPVADQAVVEHPPTSATPAVEVQRDQQKG